MDTSETYVKMSWQARKYIKKPWSNFSERQRLGTLICFRSFIGMIVNTGHKKFGGLASVISETLALRTWCDPENEDLRITEIGGDFDDEGFPLLRQDQIQEMFGDFNMVLPLFPAIARIDRIYEEKFTSFEQLWLAFYMHEKHGKVWDSEKWEKK